MQKYKKQYCMKQTALSTILMLLTLSINAQVTSVIDSMIRRLEIIQPIVHTRANYGRGQISDSYSFNMFFYESCTPECSNPLSTVKAVDSTNIVLYNKKVREKNERNLEVIRRELSKLLPLAEESYQFESHKRGGDTINISICMRAGSDVFKYKKETGVISYLNGMETIQFDYRTGTTKNCDKHKQGYGMFRYERNDQLASGESELFDWGAYFSRIEPLLEQDGIISREFLWAQDNDPEYMSGNLFKDYCTIGQIANEKGKTTEGETNGTMYVISKDKEELARSILYSINDISLQYINEHPEQEYIYKYVNAFSRHNRPDNVLNVRANNDSTVDAESMISATSVSKYAKVMHGIYCAADEQGFYFLVTKTQGALWIPKEFTKLKSMVNGKKEYYE